MTLVAKGELVLEDGGQFGLDDLSGALKASLTPGRSGKVMIRG